MVKLKKGSLTKLADAAFEQVAAQVIQRAKQSGTPVVLWEDGRVKAVPGEEMALRNTRTPQKKERGKDR